MNLHRPEMDEQPEDVVDYGGYGYRNHNYAVGAFPDPLLSSLNHMLLPPIFTNRAQSPTRVDVSPDYFMRSSQSSFPLYSFGGPAIELPGRMRPPMNVFVPHAPSPYVHLSSLMPPYQSSPNSGYDVGFGQPTQMQMQEEAFYQPPPPDYVSPLQDYAARSAPNKVLFVHDVPHDMTEDELKGLFSNYGTVVRVSLVVHAGRNRSRYAFVHFRRQEDADEALLRLNNYQVSYKNRLVSLAIYTCM